MVGLGKFIPRTSQCSPSAKRIYFCHCSNHWQWWSPWWYLWPPLSTWSWRSPGPGSCQLSASRCWTHPARLFLSNVKIIVMDVFNGSVAHRVAFFFSIPAVLMSAWVWQQTSWWTGPVRSAGWDGGQAELKLAQNGPSLKKIYKSLKNLSSYGSVRYPCWSEFSMHSLFKPVSGPIFFLIFVASVLVLVACKKYLPVMNCVSRWGWAASRTSCPHPAWNI